MIFTYSQLQNDWHAPGEWVKLLHKNIIHNHLQLHFLLRQLETLVVFPLKPSRHYTTFKGLERSPMKCIQSSIAKSLVLKM